MARINKEKQKAIVRGMTEAKQRASTFGDFVKENPKPDPNIENINEAYKGVQMVNKMIKEGFNVYDVLNDYGKGAVSSVNDTHSAPRKWEKWFGGRGDGDPSPDTKHSEIKLNECDEKHELPKRNPVLNIGKILPKGKDYETFEESSCYKKMERMWVTTHSNNYSKIEGSFIFEVDNEQWFDRVKEDYEFYLKTYKTNLKTHEKGNVVSSTVKSPNGTLSVRTDSIMITKQFFREVSEHYDK
tara:strand:+ start:881 stop:1606 length:726 start_codon:yes stop_codon:yes gene_type:complete